MNILRPIQKEFYGDDHRWFFGRVINAQPPAGLEGRVKVRIHGVHNPDGREIPEKDLPWAQVMIPCTEGSSSGIGKIPQLVAGAFVFGIFLDGASSQIPLVLGSVVHTEYPTTVQTQRIVDPQNKFEYSQNRFQNIVAETLKDDAVSRASVDLRRQQSMKFFIDNGYEVIHAAALTGALEAKSGFITHEQTDKVGIVGWEQNITIGSRYKDLLDFANNFAPSSDWRLFSIQLQFVVFELRNRFNLANSKLVNTSDIKSASKIINREYIKSKTSNSDLYAQRAYDEVFV